MEKLSLKEQLERLGPVRDIPCPKSGSPLNIRLEVKGKISDLRTIDAAMTLAHCGVGLLKAKRAVEKLQADGDAYLNLPAVESKDSLFASLSASGIKAMILGVEGEINVLEIREKLNLSREEFGLRYGIDVETLRNWEARRRRPDGASASYLLAIRNDPASVASAYAKGQKVFGFRYKWTRTFNRPKAGSKTSIQRER